jgi:hypothetical protein
VTALGWLGVVLLVGCLFAVVVEGAIAAIWMRRVSKRARLMSERLQSERGLIEADLARLRRALEETEVLWQPYRRALRFMRHPLAVALIQSLLRRRKTAARA